MLSSEPLPIPEFAGHSPTTLKFSLRVCWQERRHGFVSHLDLIRLFDRAVRRAALPVSFTGGFHPGPRISIAQALPLGVTSCGEIMDFEPAGRYRDFPATAKQSVAGRYTDLQCGRC